MSRLTLVLAVALAAALLPGVQPEDGAGRAAVDVSEARLASAVALSDADPIYPANHTFDQKVENLGSPVPNADFETLPPPDPVGTPPPNHDFGVAPAVLAMLPNGDFETGDFADYSVIEL